MGLLFQDLLIFCVSRVNLNVGLQYANCINEVISVKGVSNYQVSVYVKCMVGLIDKSIV